MPKVEKKITESELYEDEEGIVRLMVSTISVGWERKINIQNYDPKLPYESVGHPEIIWGGPERPVPIEHIEPYFDQLEELVIRRVTANVSDIIRKLIHKGRVPKLDLNAVYTAFLDGQIDDPDKDTISARWSAFLAAAGLKTEEDFR